MHVARITMLVMLVLLGAQALSPSMAGAQEPGQAWVEIFYDGEAARAKLVAPIGENQLFDINGSASLSREEASLTLSLRLPGFVGFTGYTLLEARVNASIESGSLQAWGSGAVENLTGKLTIERLTVSVSLEEGKPSLSGKIHASGEGDFASSLKNNTVETLASVISRLVPGANVTIQSVSWSGGSVRATFTGTLDPPADRVAVAVLEHVEEGMAWAVFHADINSTVLEVDAWLRGDMIGLLEAIAGLQPPTGETPPPFVVLPVNMTVLASPSLLEAVSLPANASVRTVNGSMIVELPPLQGPNALRLVAELAVKGFGMPGSTPVIVWEEGERSDTTLEQLLAGAQPGEQPTTTGETPQAGGETWEQGDTGTSPTRSPEPQETNGQEQGVGDTALLALAGVLVAAVLAALYFRSRS